MFLLGLLLSCPWGLQRRGQDQGSRPGWLLLLQEPPRLWGAQRVGRQGCQLRKVTLPLPSRE